MQSPAPVPVVPLDPLAPPLPAELVERPDPLLLAPAEQEAAAATQAPTKRKERTRVLGRQSFMEILITAR
jgi:hypothetical protein